MCYHIKCCAMSAVNEYISLLLEQAHLLAVRVHSIVTAGRSLDPEVELRIQCEQIEESIRKVGVCWCVYDKGSPKCTTVY